jgi:hypothetical protein
LWCLWLPCTRMESLCNFSVVDKEDVLLWILFLFGQKNSWSIFSFHYVLTYLVLFTVMWCFERHVQLLLYVTIEGLKCQYFKFAKINSGSVLCFESLVNGTLSVYDYHFVFSDIFVFKCLQYICSMSMCDLFSVIIQLI